MSSSDADNDPLTYVWELGEAGEPTYKASIESKFSLALGEGDWSVILTVTDPDGETNFVKHSFSVTDLPPIAMITVDKTTVFTDELIQFSGEDSYDPEGEALDFLWNFGDNKTSSLKSPQHSWTEAGMYQITLTVMADDQEGYDTKNIEIKSLGPIAKLEFKDDGGTTVEKIRSNANVTLDASESSGPDGEIKEYKWDFGDGIERTTNESTTEYSWSAGGYYNVTLIVTDENDKTGEITKLLQVVPEDYSDEGQDGSLVAQDIEQNYNLNVEIFVSLMEIEFTEISCIGVSGSLDYTITVIDSNGNEVGNDNGNIACGDAGVSWDFSLDSNNEQIELGDYQANIAFTNSGTPVQASWNYRFAVFYEF
jgi:PKD repeat protein